MRTKSRLWTHTKMNSYERVRENVMFRGGCSSLRLFSIISERFLSNFGKFYLYADWSLKIFHVLKFYLISVSIHPHLFACFKCNDTQVHTKCHPCQRFLLGSLVLYDLFVLALSTFLSERLPSKEIRWKLEIQSPVNVPYLLLFFTGIVLVLNQTVQLCMVAGIDLCFVAVICNKQACYDAEIILGIFKTKIN